MATSLTELVDAWEHTLRSTLALGATLSAHSWDRPTSCPGWSIKDHVSHLAGGERMMAGDPRPDLVLPPFPHVRNDFGALMEVDVHLRRSRPGPEVLAELAETVDRRLITLRDPSLHLDTVVEGAFGAEPAGQMLATRVFDAWTHEQDIRTALDRPGELDGPAAQTSVETYGSMLPEVIGQDAALPEGTTVVVDVTGPTPYAAALRVAAGGCCQWLPTPPAEVTLRVSSDTGTWMRRAAGRIEAAHPGVHVDGNARLAAWLREALAVTP